MDFDALFDAHQDDLPDFWGRRRSGPRFSRTFTVFGWPVQMSSNVEGVLQTADHSLPLYSTAPPLDEPPLSIHIAVRDPVTDPGPPPDNLLDVIQYTGHGHWLALHVGGWGMAFVDLEAGTATAVITPQLAARPGIVSHGLLNTLCNNLMESRGYSMLHTTSLLRDERLLLLLGAHGSGKSTTALRLALAGYTFLSDSQIYVAPRADVLQLTGFPIGKTKLRRDMVPQFPRLQPFLDPEPARGEMKYRVNLRRVDPSLVREAAVVPAGIDLCLLHRNGEAKTRTRPATRAEVEEAAMHNSIYWNHRPAWRRHWHGIERLLDAAHWHHLSVGTDPAGIVAAVDQLIGDGRLG